MKRNLGSSMLLSPARWCLVILAVMVLTLRSFGQPWWCACAQLVPWSWETISSHNSQHLIDAYSFTHVTHGLIFYALLYLTLGKVSVGWRLVAATLLEAGWEILENTSFIIDRYREATISLNYYGDSVINSVADVGCCLLGFYIAREISWKLSLMLFLIIECVLLVTIRDSLAINIIMLVSPVEAIRVWQQGAPVGL